MNPLRKIFAAQTITSTANEYHYSEKMAQDQAGWPHSSERPAFVEKLYARKNRLRDSWNVYAVTDRPGARAVINGAVIDRQRGKAHRVAKNMTLAEAFILVRAHEVAPTEHALARKYWDEQRQEMTVAPLLRDHYKIPPDAAYMHLVQKQPANDPSYWRNLQPQPEI